MSVHLKTKRTQIPLPFQWEPYYSAFSDSHSPIILLSYSPSTIALLYTFETSFWLTIPTVFKSPIFSWTYCNKPVLVKIIDNLYVTKSNILFLVLTSPSIVLIIWLSMTVLDSSPLWGRKSLSTRIWKPLLHCLSKTEYPRAWMLVVSIYLYSQDLYPVS